MERCNQVIHPEHSRRVERAELGGGGETVEGSEIMSNQES